MHGLAGQWEGLHVNLGNTTKVWWSNYNCVLHKNLIKDNMKVNIVCRHLHRKFTNGVLCLGAYSSKLLTGSISSLASSSIVPTQIAYGRKLLIIP